MFMGACNIIYRIPRSGNRIVSQGKFFINMSVINASLMTIASNSAYLGRVCLYTNIFNVIAIPIIVESLRTQNKNMTYIALFLFYLLFWAYSLKVSVALEYHSLFELWNQ